MLLQEQNAGFQVCQVYKIQETGCLFLVIDSNSISAIVLARNAKLVGIGVRAGGARGAAAPRKFGQLRFFGQQEKIWAKPVFKDVSMFVIIIIIILKR